MLGNLRNISRGVVSAVGSSHIGRLQQQQLQLAGLHRHWFSSGCLIGKAAPGFTVQASLSDNTAAPVSLKDYHGKYVVLYFYPADFTYVCASETIDFHKYMSEFKKRDCVVLGCSTDTAFVHRAWKLTSKEHGGLGTDINHPMLADLHKQIARDYNVLLDNGLCCRGVFIIDKNGKVRSEMRNDLALGRNVEEVLRVLDSIQYTDTHGDEVCPSGWKPGKPAMKASSEGVADYLTKHT